MMTTMAAMLGAIPLALGAGDGAEMRRPLGISIVGGLLVSQALTLYTTPVVYLYLDRFRLWTQRRAREHGRVHAPAHARTELTYAIKRQRHDALDPHVERGVLAAILTLLGGCMVGPDYVRPAAPDPAAYKEAAGWKVAQPSDDAPRGLGGRRFGDPELDALEAQVEIYNQTWPGRRGAGARGPGRHAGGARRALSCVINANSAAPRHGATAPDGRGKSTSGRHQQLQHRARPKLGDRPLGRHPSRHRSERATHRRPRGPRCGDAVDAGLARPGLPAAARTGCARSHSCVKPSAATSGRCSSRATVHRRRRRARRRRASRGAARVDAGAAIRRGNYACATRTCDRGARRQTALRTRDRGEAARRRLSADSGGAAVRACSSGGPTSPRPSAAPPAPTPRSESRRRRSFPSLTLSRRRLDSRVRSSATCCRCPAVTGRSVPRLRSRCSMPDCGARKRRRRSPRTTRRSRTIASTVLAGFQEVEDNLAALTCSSRRRACRTMRSKPRAKRRRSRNNQYKAGTANYLAVVVLQTAALNNERTALGDRRSPARRQRRADQGGRRRLGRGSDRAKRT